ncbi:MAG: hypothetical protein ACYCTF_05780 [Acidiferrobacter sp.]
MNSNERNADARGQVNIEGAQVLNNPQGGNEISLVQATAGLQVLAPFINKGQMQALWDLCRKGEEKAYFKQKVMDLAQLVKGMPKTYEQDGSGMEAVAYLHYFTSGFDWYITEKDMTGAGIDQAFGLAIVHERELGYISIREIVANGAELDLHWVPKILAEIKGAA